MDTRRFDQLARAFAGGASRRTVVRGLLGGAAAGVLAAVRGGRAGAQQFSVPLGGACTDTYQCDLHGACGMPAPVICGDNGIAADGTFTCCVGQGALCSADSHCCGNGRCIGLTAASCGTCQGQPTGGELAPGAACSDTSQCSQAGGATVCGDNGIAEDGALNCCRTEGGACAADPGCCASLFCVGGVCSAGSTAVPPDTADTADTADTGGLAPGAICASTGECSQASGPAICADNGIAEDGALNCCLLEVSTCTSDAECCAGLICDDNFIDEDGPLTCCGLEGSPCGSDAACCDFLYCIEGTCQALA